MPTALISQQPHEGYPWLQAVVSSPFYTEELVTFTPKAVDKKQALHPLPPLAVPFILLSRPPDPPAPQSLTSTSTAAALACRSGPPTTSPPLGILPVFPARVCSAGAEVSLANQASQHRDCEGLPTRLSP